MKAIILAAGVGRRLRPVTDHTPKCLVQLNREPLINNYFRAFNKSAISNAILVVGYMAETLKKKIGHKYMGIHVNYVYNPHYASSNSAYSLWLAKNEILESAFILADGDILFDTAILEKLVNSSYQNCLVVDSRFVDTGEEVKVVGEGGIVKRLGKLIDDRYQVVGEAVGLYKFSKNVSNLIVPGLEKHINDKGRDCEFEDALNDLLSTLRMHYITTTGLPWMDIDFPEDLKKAKLLFSTFAEGKPDLGVRDTLRKEA